MDLKEECSLPSKYSWFALAVKTRYEKAVSASLTGKGLQTLVPCYSEEKRQRYLIQPAELPLFPGYVFVYFNVADRLPVLVTPHVYSIVGYGKIPVPIPGEEIGRIQKVISSNRRAQPWPYPRAGDHIRVENGPLAGLEGTLVQVKASLRVVISVNLLQRAVAVEVGADMLSKAGAPRGEGLSGKCTNNVSAAAVG